MLKCDHCGKPLVDYGVDWLCENQECNLKDFAAIYRSIKKLQIKETYEALHSSTR